MTVLVLIMLIKIVRNIKFVLLIIFLSFVASNPVWAGGFNLKSIGSVETGGQQISHWWYTSSVPIMIGEAGPGETVTVSIDGVEGTSTADGDGNWTYTPSALDTGDHEITLTSGGSTINFTLTIGTENVDWDSVNSGGGETLPAAGVLFPTLMLTILGGVFVVLSRRIAKQN